MAPPLASRGRGFRGRRRSRRACDPGRRWRGEPLLRLGPLQDPDLLDTQVVVGQELDPPQPREARQELGAPPEVVLAVVHPRDDRYADDEVDGRAGQPAGVLQDQLVGNAGPPLVEGAVHALHVEEHEVGHGKQGLERFPGDASGGVEGRVDGGLAGAGEQRPREPRLEERLPAREGEAPARVVVVRLVAEDRRQHVLGLRPASNGVERVVRAARRAGAAHLAAPAVEDPRAGRVQRPRAVRTGRHAAPALRAVARREAQLVAHRQELGVVTPGTPQVAALQEDRRPDAGPITGREPLDPADEPLHATLRIALEPPILVNEGDAISHLPAGQGSRWYRSRPPRLDPPLAPARRGIGVRSAPSPIGKRASLPGS